MWAKVRGQEPFCIQIQGWTQSSHFRSWGEVGWWGYRNPETSKMEARTAGLGQHPFNKS